MPAPYHSIADGKMPIIHWPNFPIIRHLRKQFFQPRDFNGGIFAALVYRLLKHIDNIILAPA